ncbi:TonB-dependent receptor [Granulicella arctica]|uniref:TonB-dependent receptor n=1 Tax=Granulicella arctica TaxID=940613 RepID=UPI0021DFB4F4|nr:carboxypeptidase regulatory-like domain-containing protein [Granulicella arctica]
MRLRLTLILLLVMSISVLSPLAFAQQTGLSGVITDGQGGVLPGVNVEVKKTDGSSFFSKTNEQGAYVIPSLLAAEYTITASAPNFATVQKKIQLLVGQLAQVDLSMPIATATSAVIVEASDEMAIDTTSSVVSGNVTPKEVQDVPINGRNYISLSTLVPGIKGNSFGDVPVSGGDAETGKVQITLDGLQVSQNSVGSSFGQPRFSQDAISQFQIITNRFDATAGRSAGIYVNTQSKVGTNLIHGGAFGYFRNSFFNGSDPIAKRVLNFSDQQYGGTFGGAIKKDKLWYFGSYEGEHQPNTFTVTPTVTNVLFTHPTLLQINEYLGRADYQLNDKNHIFARGDAFNYSSSYDGAADPSTASSDARNSYGYVADWNRNVSDHFINDLHVGFHYFKTTFLELNESPVLQLPNPTITIGAPYNRPETFTQPTQQYRDDIFWLKGKHNIKVGGEFLYLVNNGYFGQNVRGSYSCTKTGTAAPSYATLFPNGTTDSSTWNYAYLRSYCTSISYVKGFGNYTIHIPRKIIGIWAQDDWKILPRFTVNLGVRYDNDIGAFLNNLRFNNGLLTPTTNPNLNFAPRLGFAYDVFGDGKTSVRGGAGLYFADINANPTIDDQLFNGVTTVQATVSNPTNLADPFAGQDPLANPSLYQQTPQFLAQGASTPYSLQASFGMARQLPMNTTMTADLVHTRTYNDYILLDGNLLQNPTNPQRNLDPTLALSPSTTRVCANGAISLDTVTNFATAKNLCNQHFGGSSAATGGNRQFTTTPGAGMLSDALQIGVKHATTKGFTAAIAYTWARTKNSTNGAFSYPNKPFLPGIQQEWANGTDDQRHTLTVNGQYNWKYGLMLSGLYHFGSGLAYATTSGNSGVNGYTAATRTFAANTTPIAPGQTCPAAPCIVIYAPLSKVSFDPGYGYWVIQRDAFRGQAYHRLDSRLQESFTLHDRYKAIVAVEAFNLLNHSNYASYGGVATSATAANGYGIPTAAGSSALEFSARSLQFIGRLQF